MNLEGYDSDEGSISGSEVPKSPENHLLEDLESDHRPAFVVTSNVQTTFGGRFQKAIPTPKIGTKRRSRTKKQKIKKQKNDPEQLDFNGPWAGSSSSHESSSDHVESDFEETETEEQENPQIGENKDSEPIVTTELYGDEDFMMPKPGPQHLKDTKLTFPRKLNYTLSGHAKGVNRVRFFPKLGHLLLSCGNDGKIFLWNMNDEKRLKVRGYFGHSQAVKDVVFNSTGDQFLSCSYDNTLLLWKTETGGILKKMRLTSTPNCALFNPNNENEIVVGLANRKIEHYDLTSPHSPLQIYDHHLGAINSLTSVNSDSVFMSTSDDRTVRFWKWHINIPTKIIADPTQHSIPCAAAHPTESFIALQSMDDTVYVIQSGGKYRYNKKKSFRGHKVAGYGIDIGFSTNGTYLMSGDVKGEVIVWSWKRGEIVQNIKLSDGVVSCLSTHPSEPNVIAAAGRKGEIYICK